MYDIILLKIELIEDRNIIYIMKRIYIKQYNWYPMPSILHKILINGAEITTKSILPARILGVKSSEARNHKEFHSHKANIQVILYRTMNIFKR